MIWQKEKNETNSSGVGGESIMMIVRQVCMVYLLSGLGNYLHGIGLDIHFIFALGA